MKVLFLIQARGGSKGFARKTLRRWGECHSSPEQHALHARFTHALGGDCRIVCSTDDPAIADASRSWGAEVPFLRPEKLAADDTPTLEVVRHAHSTRRGVG